MNRKKGDKNRKNKNKKIGKTEKKRKNKNKNIGKRERGENATHISRMCWHQAKNTARKPHLLLGTP